MNPSGPDVWGAEDTNEVIEEARALRSSMDVRLVINQHDDTNLTEAVASQAPDLGLPVLKSTVGRRLAKRLGLDFEEDSRAHKDVVLAVQKLLAKERP